ncbi:unnamed protein product [Notodromas monacha]|uniref:Uncharacterized protein n=1 Tax=Notodromas monacha TaxID=399045 RepID=A0A7R9C2I4_9CRUS|nr:unnamed protein product [Notodromas monacha]CAG0924982.1 unnamed protein product [Notodromas monacha]
MFKVPIFLSLISRATRTGACRGGALILVLHGCGAGYAVLKGCDRNARRSMSEAAGIGAGACDVGSDCWVPNRAHLNCLRGYGVAHNAAVKVRCAIVLLLCSTVHRNERGAQLNVVNHELKLPSLNFVL